MNVSSNEPARHDELVGRQVLQKVLSEEIIEEGVSFVKKQRAKSNRRFKLLEAASFAGITMEHVRR